MTRSTNSGDREFTFSFPGFAYWKRLVLVWGLIALIGLLVLVFTWNAFFTYVPPGKHLIIIAKEGAPLEPGQVLAEVGQKGIQREVKGEGWHFVLPIIYTTELADNTIIPPGKVGVVNAKGGKPLPSGRLLAEPGEQGIQRRVLPPGAYRINRYGYDVQIVDATEIPLGFVGVLRRLLGKDARGRFAERDDEKGILRKVLQPGLYYLNPKEFEVVKAEVGIFQTTFRHDDDKAKDTAITFTSRGGFPISMDCTIEWEVLPEDMPSLVAEYGRSKDVESKVIDVQAHAIGRDKGIDYGVQELLEGRSREKLQTDFTNELIRVCREKSVTVRSAFIRRIDIPEPYLKPIRDKQIAHEMQLTNKAKEVTAQSEAEVERARRMIEQEVAKVEAETKLIVAGLDQEVQNITVKTEAEIEKLKAEYQARIAALEAQRKQVMGEAETQVTKLKETAKSSLYQMKMDVFQNDGNAFLRYTLAEQLNPKMVLRLFHSGPGTFWTNMDGKSFNLMVPAPTGPAAKAATAAR